MASRNPRPTCGHSNNLVYDIPLGYAEFFLQKEDKKLYYRKIRIYGRSAVRLNSDRLSRYANVSGQEYTRYRLEVAVELPLEAYESGLLAEQRARYATAYERYCAAAPASMDGPIRTVDIDFDILFAYRALIGAAFSKKVITWGNLLWSGSHGEFGGPLGSLKDSALDALFEDLFKGVLKIGNVDFEWVLNVATRGASKLAAGMGDEVMYEGEERNPFIDYRALFLASEAARKLAAAGRFRALVLAQSFRFSGPSPQVPIAPPSTPSNPETDPAKTKPSSPDNTRPQKITLPHRSIKN